MTAGEIVLAAVCGGVGGLIGGGLVGAFRGWRSEIPTVVRGEEGVGGEAWD